MSILEVAARSDDLIKQLCRIWEKSVRATHLFLSEDDIQMISQYIPSALLEIPHLLIARNEASEPAAFLGIEGNKVEMLFVLPEKKGLGLGKRLVQYAREKFNVSEVCVNEQNPEARGFYERLGFAVYKRTESDEQGNPFPLLYMKLL